MEKKDFYFLGKVTKTSGYLGNLMFFFDVDDINNYRELEAVFIEVHNELVPFAIQTITFKNNQTAYVTLEDIKTEEEAAVLVGSDLYLPLAFLPTLTGKRFYYHEIIGFDIIDATHGNIGKVQSVIDQGPQAILSVLNKGKEILIPVSDHIIQKLDRKTKTINVDTPEGLIDLYL